MQGVGIHNLLAAALEQQQRPHGDSLGPLQHQCAARAPAGEHEPPHRWMLGGGAGAGVGAKPSLASHSRCYAALVAFIMGGDCIKQQLARPSWSMTAHAAQPPRCLQSKYVGTGHPDINRFEWNLNIKRDTYASFIGHQSLTAYHAVAENESMGRIKYNFLQVRGWCAWGPQPGTVRPLPARNTAAPWRGREGCAGFVLLFPHPQSHTCCLHSTACLPFTTCRTCCCPVACRRRRRMRLEGTAAVHARPQPPVSLYLC